MTDIVQMSKGGTKLYPQTHAQAIVGLNSVGTNLLINSNFSSGLDHWNVNAGSAVVTTDSDGDTCIHITATGTGTGYGIWSPPASFNQNQVTTGSVMAKGIGTICWIGLEGRPQSNFGTISTKSYSKIGSTAQGATGPNNFVVYFNPVDGVVDVYIKFVKLEKGTIATDYSVNPLDYLSSEDVKAKIAEQIKANQPDLSGLQKASDVQTAISNDLGKFDTSQTMNTSIRNKLQNMNKEMGS